MTTLAPIPGQSAPSNQPVSTSTPEQRSRCTQNVWVNPFIVQAGVA